MKHYTPVELDGTASPVVDLDVITTHPYLRTLIRIAGGTSGSYDIYARRQQEDNSNPQPEDFSKVIDGNIDLTTSERDFEIYGWPLTHIMLVPVGSPSAATATIASMAT